VTLPGERPTITVVVPTRDRRETAVPCVAAAIAAARAYERAEVVIVDNGSVDGTYELLRERHAEHARLLRRPDRTIAALRNIGVSCGSGRYLSFIDSDCLVAPDYFHRAIEALAAAKADACGSPYALPDRPHWLERSWHELHAPPCDGVTRYLPAGNLVIARSAFDAVGGFRDDLITGEDAELGRRLTQAGFRLYLARDVRAVHLGNPKTLRQFFVTQLWHGLGWRGTSRGWALDRPTLMALAHALTCLAGLAAAVFMPLPLAGALTMGLGLPWIVPAVTAGFRMQRAGRASNPLAALLLYQLYYLARLCAMLARSPADVGRPARSVSE